MRLLILAFALTGCGGLAWDTTVAETPDVRAAMVASVVHGVTTETGFVTRWGLPTQKVREGGEVRFIYRNMDNPPEITFPQFGNSADYVIVRFQYGVAVGAYSSDMEGCRATFPPRPPGPGLDNPATVHPVNCGAAAAMAARRGGPGGDAPLDATGRGYESPGGGQGVPEDVYVPGDGAGK